MGRVKDAFHDEICAAAEDYPQEPQSEEEARLMAGQVWCPVTLEWFPDNGAAEAHWQRLRGLEESNRRLAAALDVAREHICHVNNFARHTLTVAVEEAAEKFMKEASGQGALRSIRDALASAIEARQGEDAPAASCGARERDPKGDAHD